MEKVRAVLDANVLVRMMSRNQGACTEIGKYVGGGKVSVVLCPFVLRECYSAFSQMGFKGTDALTEPLALLNGLALLRTTGNLEYMDCPTPEQAIKVFARIKDRTDAYLLALTEQAGEDVIFVTTEKRLLSAKSANSIMETTVFRNELLKKFGPMGVVAK